MSDVRYPALYQINTRVWFTALSRELGKRVTFDDIPDAELDRLADLGFDWVWFLSIWQTDKAAREVSRAKPEWRHEFAQTLSDLKIEDIAGSGFAIQSYSIHRDLGTPESLARLRQRLQRRGLKLMLDFVPNHMAPDHPWIDEHPDYFVHGNEADLARSPQNYCWVESRTGPLLLAHGRDPYFDGWPDTVQLNYGNPELQQAMIGELERIAGQCDGVRCDMAMLVLPDVFERTWGIHVDPFWLKATESVRHQYPQFKFVAEVYWDLEWTMLQLGFDYAYDKRLYDRLRNAHVQPLREHLHAGVDYQSRLVRFMENHDEPRAAATFAPAMHKAAAIVTYLSPGMRFFHQGQFEGCRKHISPHLARGPQERVDPELQRFYTSLLVVLQQAIFRDGAWSLIECVPAWEGNWTWDCFIAWYCQSDDGERRFIAVNYADNQSQCYARVPPSDVTGRMVRVKDLLGETSFDRDGDDLAVRGLYLDLPPWSYHVFELTAS